MAEVVPEVGTFRFSESCEFRGLCCRRSAELGEFAGGALADFGIAFYADAKVPAIHWEFSLKRGGWRCRRILFGFEE